MKKNTKRHIRSSNSSSISINDWKQDVLTSTDSSHKYLDISGTTIFIVMSGPSTLQTGANDWHAIARTSYCVSLQRSCNIGYNWAWTLR